jgi:hypothetical protein
MFADNSKELVHWAPVLNRNRRSILIPNDLSYVFCDVVIYLEQKIICRSHFYSRPAGVGPHCSNATEHNKDVD